MKKLFLLISLACGVATAAEFIPVGNALTPVAGKVIGVDVKSTDANDAIAFKRVRNIKTYTNGIDVITTVYTNATQYFDYSNQTWVATNIITRTTTTNVVRLVEFDIWKTNALIDVVCDGGFATSNIVGGAWFVPGDFIFANGADDGVRSVVIIEK